MLGQRFFAAGRLTALALLLATSPAAAGIGRWTPIGPAGGTALLMYASDDFGVTWTLMYQGLPFVGIADLQLDAQVSRRLYVATLGGGIYSFTRP